MTNFTIGVEPRCYALVPCAGSGSRSGSFVPKQYAPVGGLPLVAYTLAALARVPRLSATLVVLAPDDDLFADELPAFQGEACWTAKVGGDSRAATVLAGLAELRARGVQPHDWVLVHDAARCLIRPEWVERLIDTCWHDEVGGLLALPLADTLKAAGAGAAGPAADRISATLDREGKWAAQTPQMFRLGLLEPVLSAALEAGTAITDEASAVEAAGHAPRLVRGDWENLKVTFPGDFALAERLLATGPRAPELRPVLPVPDLALAEAFYADLGFQREFSRGGMAGYRMGLCCVLLRQAPLVAAPDLAAALQAAAEPEPLTLHLTLGDLDAFWARITREGLVERHGVACEPPVERPWGLKEMLLHDPAGTRWRISQRLDLPQ